jgi:transposase-like protein
LRPPQIPELNFPQIWRTPELKVEWSDQCIKKIQKKYDEEFKRQAVELVIHSGKL